MRIQKAVRYRLEPTPEQESLLVRAAGCVRFVWNRALAIQKSYLDSGCGILSYVDLAKCLTTWRNGQSFGFLAESPSQPQQQALRNLDRAFKEAFNPANLKRFPVFKKKGRNDSLHYPDPEQIKFDLHRRDADGRHRLPRLFLPKIGWVKFRKSCPIGGEIRNVTVCRHCEVARPCLRCGKTDYRIGRVTSSGPVCNSCAKYFKEAEACELCGKLSKRLTRISRFKHDLRLCPQCARADHGNCHACHHHRLLMVTGDGRRLCKACFEGALIPCQECGQPMPAGRIAQCEACYWRSLLKKRIAMNQAAFSAQTMARRFEHYAVWLTATVGENKTAITLNKYLPFFLEMEKLWKDIPDYARLIAHFSAEGLRRVRLPHSLDGGKWTHSQRCYGASRGLREKANCGYVEGSGR